MSDLEIGDIVSLSHVQTSRVDVSATPGAPNTPYTVNLPINGNPKAFTHLGNPGNTLTQLASAIVAVLLRDQTHFSVAVGPVSTAFTIVGELGETFTLITTSNLTPSLVESAVAATDGAGNLIGKLRVIQAESNFERLRKFTTRDRNQSTQEIELVLLRELNTSNLFDVERSKILTIVEEVGHPT